MRSKVWGKHDEWKEQMEEEAYEARYANPTSHLGSGNGWSGAKERMTDTPQKGSFPALVRANVPKEYKDSNIAVWYNIYDNRHQLRATSFEGQGIVAHGLYIVSAPKLTTHPTELEASNDISPTVQVRFYDIEHPQGYDVHVPEGVLYVMKPEEQFGIDRQPYEDDFITLQFIVLE